MGNETELAAFRLSLELGIPVSELRRRLTTRDLVDYVAYWRHIFHLSQAAREVAEKTQ